MGLPSSILAVGFGKIRIGFGLALGTAAMKSKKLFIFPPCFQ